MWYTPCHLARRLLGDYPAKNFPPHSGITAVCHPVWLFMWALGIHLSSWACKTSAFLYPRTISAALDSGSDVMRAYRSLGYGLDRDWLGGGRGRGFLNIPGPPCPCALRGTVTKAVYRRSLFGLWFQAHKSPWWWSKGSRWQVASG